MIEFPIYCGGEFISTPFVLPVTNPFSGESFACTYLADSNLINSAIEAALKSLRSLKGLSSGERSQILTFVASELDSQKEDFAKLIAQEAAKPLKYALLEVERAIQTFRIASEETKRWPGEVIKLDWTKQGKNKECIVNYFPIGVVAGISPFNFPLNLAVHKIAPAIAAACPIILKPASKTPLSTLKLAQIIHQSGLPKGALSVLPCSRETGQILVEDERIKLLSFTGSPEIGWALKEKARKKKTILELGGNAGLIVTESANLNLAVSKAVVGGFAYSGQVCIHTQRILIHETVFDKFCNDFIQKIKAFRIGDPLDIDTDISCMIDESNALRVSSWINEAIENGAKLLTGGKKDNLIVEPTVLTGTQPNDKVNCEEVFGPVVTVEPFKDFEEAIAIVNNSRFGLQAGVFTNLQSEINLAYQNLEVGGVLINDVPTFRVDHMPYGGVKDSGMGREGVKYAMLDMLEPKALIKDIF